MKIAVTSTGPDLTSQIDPRFGRCQFFIIVNPDNEEFETFENPNIQAMGGAGIQSAQFIANKGAEVVLTGSCGPNAFQTLSAAGIKVITGVTGTIKDAVRRFKSGQLKVTQQPNVGSHFGAGFGMGRGMGRGMGAGMGRGIGRGMFPGMGYVAGVQGPLSLGGISTGMPPSGMNKKQELEFLKQQAEMLKKQIEDINIRIKELEKKG